jgi:hypothetical protein
VNFEDVEKELIMTSFDLCIERVKNSNILDYSGGKRRVALGIKN